MVAEVPYPQFGPPQKDSIRIAVLIPCYNEELSIGKVVGDFRAELPDASVYVFDNNSTDRTVELARASGALIGFETRQGKGYVVQKMFREVEADVYVMVDGDGTYPPPDVHRLIAPILEGQADMVVGSRLARESVSEFKLLNRWGNHLFLLAINVIFSVQLTDILSGYRAFNRKFAKSVPIFGGGFETEVELTIKALGRGYQILECPIDLRARTRGSFSKIRIVRDGLLILHTIFALSRDYKPLTFFGAIGLFLVALGCIPGGLVIEEFIRTGLVTRLPSAILSVGVVLSGFLSLTVGILLHTVTRRFQELDHQLELMSRVIGARKNGINP